MASAGFSRAGVRPPSILIATVADRGYEISEHLSQRVQAEDVEHADLSIGMDFEHCRKLAVLAPARLSRIYTLAELVDRGEKMPPDAE